MAALPVIALALVTGAGVLACGAEEPPEPAAEGDPAALARCLTERGLTVYSSKLCSACRAQRREFGLAYAHVREVECHPRAENTQVDLCLERRIRVTPTWILDRDGEEVLRLEGAQTLDALAELAGCGR